MSNTFEIKICGISDKNCMLTALECKVDYIGLVFYEKSPRNITIGNSKKLLDNRNKFSKIVALTVDPDDNFIENLNISIENMNKADPDWDILFLDALCRDCIPYQDNIVKVNKFYLMHAYIIRRKAIKKMFDYKMLFPINQQIDWCIGSHSNILKLYTVTNGFVKQGDFSTDIQIGIKKHKNINPNSEAPSI